MYDGLHGLYPENLKRNTGRVCKMSIGYILVDIPENCMSCKLSENHSIVVEDCVYCKVAPEGVNGCRIDKECYEKPRWCPIKKEMNEGEKK